MVPLFWLLMCRLHNLLVFFVIIICRKISNNAVSIYNWFMSKRLPQSSWYFPIIVTTFWYIIHSHYYINVFRTQFLSINFFSFYLGFLVFFCLGLLKFYVRVTLILSTLLWHWSLKFNLAISAICSTHIIIHFNPSFCPKFRLLIWIFFFWYSNIALLN